MIYLTDGLEANSACISGRYAAIRALFAVTTSFPAAIALKITSLALTQWLEHY
jgi:hypothetical protein